ncbi:vitamin K epoxide reductase family protein [Specibacter cremeus]|uniref:vitamin K epoxide reductase family protein n=1 Tax=Specibacter cremeus TaxID=1629051 RepID=UPI000F7B987D|nr:vitamin K epoxide reductase family protein [Specibacter cremeus]
MPKSSVAPSTVPHGPDAAEAKMTLLARHRPYAWLLLATGVVAWLASGALVLDRLELYKNPNASLSCNFNTWISCGDVMKTQQAELLGFPNPFIGIVGFAVIITTAVVMLAGARLARWYWIGLQIGITLGMALVCWFWFEALYVITILCPYCMVVWAMMIPLFVFTTVRNLSHGVIPAPAGLTRFAGEWAWVIAGLGYLAVIATIFFRFMHLIIPSNA